MSPKTVNAWIDRLRGMLEGPSSTASRLSATSSLTSGTT